MNKKEKIIVLDVETTGSLESPLVYDLGFAITNKAGEIFEKYHFVISDIFDNSELMKSAYYYDKLPKYFKGLLNGSIEKLHFQKHIVLCMH